MISNIIQNYWHPLQDNEDAVHQFKVSTLFSKVQIWRLRLPFHNTDLVFLQLETLLPSMLIKLMFGVIYCVKLRSVVSGLDLCWHCSTDSLLSDISVQWLYLLQVWLTIAEVTRGCLRCVFPCSFMQWSVLLWITSALPAHGLLV